MSGKKEKEERKQNWVKLGSCIGGCLHCESNRVAGKSKLTRKWVVVVRPIGILLVDVLAGVVRERVWVSGGVCQAHCALLHR